MIKTYKVMLHPNKKQCTKLFEFAGAARYAYNWALATEMKAFENGLKFIPEGELRKQFTECKKQLGNEWMNTISNDVLKQAIRDCIKAYDRFFKLQKKPGYVKYSKQKLQKLEQLGKKPSVYDMTGHPKFKTRKHTKPSFYQDPIKIRFSKTHIKLEKITDKRKKQHLNWIKLAEFDRIPIDGHYSNPRITYDGINWWLSVGIEVPERKPIIKQYSEPVGVDLGVKSVAVVSNGTVYKNINKSKRIKKLEKHLCRLQRSISRKYLMKGESYKKTCNIIKSENKLKKLYRRLSNIRHNYIQTITSEIVYRKPRWIALEDLNVKGMMKNKHLAKHIQDCCWSLFRQLIVYRANKFGIKIVLADRFYSSSSKTCSHCGYKQDMPLSKRVYRCPQCGMVMDRDLNAAINIKNYGETH